MTPSGLARSSRIARQTCHSLACAIVLYSLLAAWGTSETSAGGSKCFGRTPTIVGGPGNNHLDGTPGVDVIASGGGDDVVDPHEGDDFVCGPGDDELHGGGQGDKIADLSKGGGGDLATPDRLGGSAVAQRGADRPNVLVVTSGNGSETRKTIPITRRSRADRRVVMSMRPRSLPDPKAGDRLVLSAELMVTLDCHRRVPACVGRPYLFNARVGSQLVLARGRNATGGRRATPISARMKTTCRGNPLSSRQHHCVIVFKRVSFEVDRRSALPCAPRACRVNLVLDAHSRRAHRGNKLVIGNNRPTGVVSQDKGRINAIRLRPGGQPSPPKAISRRRRRRFAPLTQRPTVVVSVRLTGLKKNEQLAVLARFKTDVSRLPYTARVSSHLILARSPRATKPSPRVRRIASFDGEIDEMNAENCTSIQTPCPYPKVGVLRMTGDARSRSGRQIPLYVNLYVISNPKRAPRRPGDRLAIRSHPKLEVARYRPSLRG